MTKLASVTIYEQYSISFARDLIPFAWIIISFYRDLIPFARIINSFSRDLIPFSRNINSFSQDLIPFARIINSFSRDLIPFARITNPFSRDLIPFAWITNSFSRDLISFARVINPFSRDLISFARIINPFSRDLIPFARIINPFSRDVIPFARIINSFSRETHGILFSKIKHMYVLKIPPYYGTAYFAKQLSRISIIVLTDTSSPFLKDGTYRHVGLVVAGLSVSCHCSYPQNSKSYISPQNRTRSDRPSSTRQRCSPPSWRISVETKNLKKFYRT